MNLFNRPSFAVNLSLSGAWLAIFLVVTLWRLPEQTIAGPDEPRYACAVRSMLRGGDWLIPEFNTRPRLAKPALFYWLIAATGWLGQVAGLGLVTGMRLGPIFMSGVTVLTTFLLAQRLAGKRVGLLSAGILMTTLQFNRIARELVVDMTLTAFVTCAWLCFHVALVRIQRNRGAFAPLLAFYLAVGLACLTKGPVLVALFIVFPIIAFLLWTRQFRILLHSGKQWGAPISLLVGLSWYAAIYARGHDTLGVFLSDNFTRMTGQGDHRHPVPMLFYLEVIWEHFAPWSLFIPFAAWRLIRSNRIQNWLGSDGRFVACALGVPLVLLGFAVSKRGLYLMPLYPFIAFVIAFVFESLLTKFKVHHCLDCLAAITVGAAVCLICESTVHSHREQEKSSAQFFDTVRTVAAGKTVVMFGESANETIWYLDRNEPVDRLSRSELKSRFFSSRNTALLISDNILAKEPALAKSIQCIATMPRGRRIYVIAVPSEAVVTWANQASQER